MKIRFHWRCDLPGSHGSEAVDVPDETTIDDLEYLAREYMEANLHPTYWYEPEEE